MQLYVYGPGGPYTPMTESARLFSRLTGIEVSVVMGTPGEWMAEAREKADCYYGGAEYMMDELIAAYPGIVDVPSVTSLHSREIGILVRPGNPLGISVLADLGRKKAGILDIKLEKMEHLQERGSVAPDAILLSMVTGKEGFDIWPARTDLDAWITYRSWHVKLAGASEFVRLPADERQFRRTPVAIARRSSNREEARRLIDFLASEPAHVIFQKWGWE